MLSNKRVNLCDRYALVDKVKASGADVLHFDIQRRGTEGLVGVDVKPNTVGGCTS